MGIHAIGRGATLAAAGGTVVGAAGLIGLGVRSIGSDGPGWESPGRLARVVAAGGAAAAGAVLAGLGQRSLVRLIGLGAMLGAALGAFAGRSKLVTAPTSAQPNAPAAGVADRAPTTSTPTIASTTTSTLPTTTTTVERAPAQPPPDRTGEAPAETEPAKPISPVWEVGDAGAEIGALKDRLRELGYAVDTGEIYTRATRDAVMAFQKLNGLERDGIAGPQTLAALDDPLAPQLGDGPADRVDVDLSAQVMVVVRNGKVAYIVNATTGNPNHPDGQGVATPVGSFTVQRKIAGTRHAPLGDLYWPSYFHGGIAVHGSESILAHRDSHGCVRVPRWLEERIHADMPVGSAVVVHG